MKISGDIRKVSLADLRDITRRKKEEQYQMILSNKLIKILSNFKFDSFYDRVFILP